MSKRIKVAQYGCGKMSVYTMRYLLEKGCELVAAFDVDPKLVGQDIGTILGQGTTGLLIRHAHDAEETLKKIRPDTCIITTMSLLSDVQESLMVCARTGVNAITTCEEAFYPWNSSPKITDALDRIAKENGCTLCGSGYQDVFWGNLISVLAGATHKICRIRGSSSYNVEDYGIALARAHGAGLSLTEFEKEVASADRISEEERRSRIEQGTFLPSYMWNVNGWLCAKLGLTVLRQTQKCIPQTHTEDLHSDTLGLTIPAGNATGMSAIVTTETVEGVVIEAECIGKVYAPEEFDRNDWMIEGEPNTRIIVNRPSTVELTCATVVNRLPDLISAPAGFVTSDKMPTPKYRSLPLSEYLS